MQKNTNRVSFRTAEHVVRMIRSYQSRKVATSIAVLQLTSYLNKLLQTGIQNIPISWVLTVEHFAEELTNKLTNLQNLLNIQIICSPKSCQIVSI